MSWYSIRQAVAQWIRPDSTITDLQEQLVATRKQLADSSAALATASGQLASVTAAIAGRDTAISQLTAANQAQAAELTAWESQADTTIATETQVASEIAAVSTPATPAAQP